MCPSYMATREEEHATRGRANALVKALSAAGPGAALGDERLHEILDLCLECKACKSECPLCVDMATLKSEFLSHYHDIHGVAAALAAVRLDPHAEPPRRRDRAAVQPAGPRRVRAQVAGIDRRRPLPRFARETLIRPAPAAAAATAARSSSSPTRFTTFTEPGRGPRRDRAARGRGLRASGWRAAAAAGGRASPRGCSTRRSAHGRGA